MGAVGSYQGLGLQGTYDMAGNLKEWCWNESEEGRLIVGGSWNEPAYMFHELDAQLPFRREASYGFRCMKTLDEIPQALTGRVENPWAMADDYLEVEPISDEVFALYQRLFAYDRVSSTLLSSSVMTPQKIGPWKRLR